MNSYEVVGLPLHILLVHAVVVLGPLTALAIVLHAFLPAARRRLGFLTPLAALIVLVLVPITVDAGEALETKTGVTPAIQAHADLGRTLLPWVIALFVVALVQYVWYRMLGGAAGGRPLPRWVRTGAAFLLMAASVVVAVGTTVDIILVGDAGSRAVWGTLFR